MVMHFQSVQQALERRISHLCVVLLEVGQFVLQAFDLHLQVGLGEGGLVQQAAQVGDVGLHRLAHHQLMLVPEQNRRKSTDMRRLRLEPNPEPCSCATNRRSPQSCNDQRLLVPEVVCSQLGVVDLEEDVGVADGGGSDLCRRTTRGVSHKAKVSAARYLYITMQRR